MAHATRGRHPVQGNREQARNGGAPAPRAMPRVTGRTVIDPSQLGAGPEPITPKPGRWSTDWSTQRLHLWVWCDGTIFSTLWPVIHDRMERRPAVSRSRKHTKRQRRTAIRQRTSTINARPGRSRGQRRWSERRIALTSMYVALIGAQIAAAQLVVGIIALAEHPPAQPPSPSAAYSPSSSASTPIHGSHPSPSPVDPPWTSRSFLAAPEHFNSSPSGSDEYV
jgi:hypothetical protein